MIQSYVKLIGHNISEMDYTAINNEDDKHLKQHGANGLKMNEYDVILPTLKRIQLRHVGQWFGATNHWIKSPPDIILVCWVFRTMKRISFCLPSFLGLSSFRRDQTIEYVVSAGRSTMTALGDKQVDSFYSLDSFCTHEGAVTC